MKHDVFSSFEIGIDRQAIRAICPKATNNSVTILRLARSFAPKGLSLWKFRIVSNRQSCGWACSGLAVRSSVLPVLTTMIRSTILHSSNPDIMAPVVVAAADVMDMDKAECSINRILPVRHPRCRESSEYKISTPISDTAANGDYGDAST